MADPFRNLRLYWHRLRNTQRVTLDGVQLNTDASQVKQVRSALFKRSYEGPERMLVQRVVRPNDTVLEIGAGIGFVGLLCARLAAPGRVVSFEANPVMEPVIVANYALNPVAPELRMRAVTRDGTPVRFHTSDNVISSSLYARAETGSEVIVPSKALTDVLAEIEPDVLVMDVEGAEVDLLDGPEMQSVRAAIVELHPHVVGEDRIAQMLQALAQRGFAVRAEVENNVVLSREALA